VSSNEKCSRRQNNLSKLRNALEVSIQTTTNLLLDRDGRWTQTAAIFDDSVKHVRLHVIAGL